MVNEWGFQRPVAEASSDSISCGYENLGDHGIRRTLP